MLDYIWRHWRGEHSLARSYWVNTFLFGLAIQLGATLVGDPLVELRLETSIFLALVVVALLVLLTVWQFVGLWRSATQTARRTGRALWPRVAKGVVILGSLGGAFTVTTATIDVFNVWRILHEEDIAGYSLARLGDTELMLVGAINHQSVDEVILALKDPKVEVLRIDSPGGLTEPAIRLARYIRDKAIFVSAEGECVSACVWILIASPYPAIEAGTPVVFHATQPLVEFTNPELREENLRFLEEVEAYDRELGIPDWVGAKLKQREFWTATVEELIEMGFLAYIYDPEVEDYLAADAYCLSHAAVCRERVDYNQEAE